MDTNKIKEVVTQAKALTRGEQEAEPVMAMIVKNMGKSPLFAAAIIQHLKEDGYDLMVLSGEQAEAFKAKFKPQMEKLGERELSQVKKIVDKLFSA